MMLADFQPLDYVHAEFYHADDRADIQLVEYQEPAPVQIVGTLHHYVQRWGVRWHFHSEEADRLEKYPSEKEARMRYIQLLAASGVSP